MSLARIFESWTAGLQSSANVKNVFGDPIEVQGRTLVPVARVSYGFGGGSGPANVEQAGDEPTSPEKAGGGGGAYARPVGVLEVTDEGTRFIPTRTNTRLYVGIAAGFMLGLWLAGRRK